MRKYGIFAFLLALSAFAAAQANSNQDNQNVFTINITPPTSPRDVQVRYFLSGDPSVQQASVAQPGDNKIAIQTDVAGKPSKGFRAIIYSPGCQFGTVTADDLATSTRTADFQCQKLATNTLHGKADVSRFSGKQLQVEALYVCRWAGQFFHIPGLSISPFSVAKTKVADDGTFAIDLPNFSADPIWNNLSKNATLVFALIDSSNGEHLGRLVPPTDISRGSAMKIAASYPAEVEFTVK
jgi:hypothetical protein